jgi:CubicO group peptidase (beta-lactamase class C family)
MSNPLYRLIILGLKSLSIWLSAIAMILVTMPASGQTGSSDTDIRLIESLRSFIPHVMSQNGTPGLSIALARHGKVIWEEGFGYADLTRKTRMTPQTVNRAGSMSKLYTATAVMQLVETGLIALNDPVNKYTQGFKIVNPLGDREITVYDLLTHRSGLTSNAAGCDFSPPPPLAERLKVAPGEKMERSYKGTLSPRWSAKVGEKFQYSNLGLATLGYLVEVTNPEKLSFSDYVQKHIMEPLGMKSSQFPPVLDDAHIRPDLRARASTGYSQLGPLHVPTPNVLISDFPAGTLITTPGDHIRLLLAYLNKGTYEGHQILKPETVQQMLTPQVEITKDRWVGLIWWIGHQNKLDYNYGHAGAYMFGWFDDSLVYPEQDFALVISMNKWDVVTQAGRTEIQLIEDYVSDWLRNKNTARHAVQPGTTWAWKTSYVAALVMVDDLRGALGMPGPITGRMIDLMTSGAVARNDKSVWDPAGFRAGVEDMASVEMTPTGIKAFLESDRLRVAPEELEVLFREIGGSGKIPGSTTLRAVLGGH